VGLSSEIFGRHAAWSVVVRTNTFALLQDRFVVNGGGRDEGRGILTEAILLLKQRL
jgi:hypothetical protein